MLIFHSYIYYIFLNVKFPLRHNISCDRCTSLIMTTTLTRHVLFSCPGLLWFICDDVLRLSSPLHHQHSRTSHPLHSFPTLQQTFSSLCLQLIHGAALFACAVQRRHLVFKNLHIVSRNPLTTVRNSEIFKSTYLPLCFHRTLSTNIKKLSENFNE